jgi:hypothetical protein
MISRASRFALAMQRAATTRNICMLPNLTILELQNLSDCRTARTLLRSSGTGQIAAGCLLFGLEYFAGTFDLIFILVGIFLILAGILNILIRKPILMLMDSGLSVLGSVALGLFAYQQYMHTNNVFFFPLFVSFAVGYGAIQSFRNYKRFAKLHFATAAGQLQWIDSTVVDILKSVEKTSEDIIEFRAKGVSEQSWKGKLSTEIAIFVKNNGQELLFARKDMVHFTEQDGILSGKPINTLFQIENQTLRGTISERSLARYKVWKESTTST